MKRTTILVVEDDPRARAHIVATLRAAVDLEVVGEAGDAMDAVPLVKSLHPDVVTLDLQLANGGGQSVIEQIMAYAPTPILVLSAGEGHASEAAVDALVAGAVDVLPKPRSWTADAEDALRARVRLVAGVTVIRHHRARAAARSRAPRRDERLAQPIVAIGASTGGPAALAEVLAGLKGTNAAVLVVQHLHAEFVTGMVAWMARVAAMRVKLAEDGERVEAATVYIAPGGQHLRIGEDDHLVLDEHPMSVHRPSVDELFTSLAARPHGRNIGVLLTGMGEDGAAGLLAMRRRGDMTVIQDQASSVVWGMPGTAHRLGAATHVVPLDEIAATIMRAL